MYMYSMSPAGVESGPSWYTVVSYYWLLTTAMYNMSYYNIPLLLSNYMYQHTHTHTHARTHTHTHTHTCTHTHTHTCKQRTGLVILMMLFTTCVCYIAFVALCCGDFGRPGRICGLVGFCIVAAALIIYFVCYLLHPVVHVRFVFFVQQTFIMPFALA